MNHPELPNLEKTNEFSLELKLFLNDTRSNLKGSERRKFMANVVRLMGKGGQRRAEKELGWDRKTIQKGTKELDSGFDCIDNFSGRGRKPVEEKLPNLLDDIKDIIEPTSQCDPTFRTTQLYSPLTGVEVLRRLREDKKYSPEQLPTVQTIRYKLNQLGYRLKKVAKTKPPKKIAETDAIFSYVKTANQVADSTEGVIRISIDTKANVKVGPFSRGGYSRQKVKACDHDYKPDTILKPFGIFLPAHDESYIYFTESNATADFMVDCLEDLWPMLKTRFKPHTIAINADNGPENNSRRSQFMKRLVNFAIRHEVSICLIYYPPYHSKYNPVERLWGILENHWKGQLLDSVDKVVGLARTMTYNGIHPVAKLITKIYEKGVKIGEKAMERLEEMIERIRGIEKWAVDIPCY
ncbi:ISAzo13 family transposase [uncultured Desulfobacter sp.]|uniref:ISAzo13 family transposase n=1 Tax=uncultured Desulfobacter sp. TaxID=240139 RepID=UPI003747BEFC